MAPILGQKLITGMHMVTLKLTWNCCGPSSTYWSNFEVYFLQNPFCWASKWFKWPRCLHKLTYRLFIESLWRGMFLCIRFHYLVDFRLIVKSILSILLFDTKLLYLWLFAAKQSKSKCTVVVTRSIAIISYILLTCMHLSTTKSTSKSISTWLDCTSPYMLVKGSSITAISIIIDVCVSE